MDVIPEILERLKALEEKQGIQPAAGATAPAVGTPDQTIPEEHKPETTPFHQQ